MRQVASRVLIVVGCLLLIPVTAVLTAAAKQRFADGSNRVFSGGPLVSGELHAGPEPDWSFTDDVQTIDLQLLDPPRSRRIWIQAHDDKIYVFSGFMSTAVGRLWKRWPVQAESDGRAVLRIDGRALRAATRAYRIGSGARRHHQVHSRQVHVRRQPGHGGSGGYLGVRGRAAVGTGPPHEVLLLVHRRGAGRDHPGGPVRPGR